MRFVEQIKKNISALGLWLVIWSIITGGYFFTSLRSSSVPATASIFVSPTPLPLLTEPVPTEPVELTATISASATATSRTVLADSPTATASPTPEPTLTSTATSLPPTPTLTPTSATDVFYTIQSGDTLWDVASRFGTTVAVLRAANPNIDSSNLRIGQRIQIPKDVITPTVSP